MSGLREFTHFDRSQLDAVTGIRSAIFALTPLLLGLVAGQASAGAVATLGSLNEDVVSTLGAINLPLTEPAPSPVVRRVGPPSLACLLNALAFSFGTLVGVAGALTIPLVAMGVFTGLIVRLRRDLFQVGLVASIVFVVGVGLPGGSEAAAYSRFWLILAGGLWAFFGALLQWLALKGRGPVPPPAHTEPSSNEVAAHSVIVAITVAAGLAISYWAGLARDYWVMLTIISCVRLRPSVTLSFTVMRVVGTVVGAVVALCATFAIGASWLAVLPLFVFGVGMFSMRNSNYMVFTIFLTAFIIVLLNLAYPGNQSLALTRVLDTCIGGVLSLAAGAALWSALPKPASPRA